MRTRLDVLGGDLVLQLELLHVVFLGVGLLVAHEEEIAEQEGEALLL